MDEHLQAVQRHEDALAAAGDRRERFIGERSRYLIAQLAAGHVHKPLDSSTSSGEAFAEQSIGEAFAEWVITEYAEPDAAICTMVEALADQTSRNVSHLFSAFAEYQAELEAADREPSFWEEDTDA